MTKIKTEEILKKLIYIKVNTNFSENRNDARMAYKLLKENTIELRYEKNLFNENLFIIEHSILTEFDRKIACQRFLVAITKIINIIDYNINGKNYEKANS